MKEVTLKEKRKQKIDSFLHEINALLSLVPETPERDVCLNYVLFNELGFGGEWGGAFPGFLLGPQCQGSTGFNAGHSVFPEKVGIMS